MLPSKHDWTGAKESSQSLCELAFIASLALPKNEDTPFLRPQLSHVSRVPSDITFEFGLPELLASLGSTCTIATRMLMPEAPVHKNELLPAGKHNVRRPS